MILKKIKVDGVANTAANFLKVVSSFFYRKTYTIMLEENVSYDVPESDPRVIELSTTSQHGSFLLNLPMSRFHDWNSENAVTLVIEVDGAVVGYIVVHFSKYYVAGLGHVDLEKKQAAWIGPVFVDFSYRGLGINRALISSALNLCRKEGRVALTSTNIDNIASIRSFEIFGFTVVQIFRSNYLFGKLSITKVFKNYV